MSEWLAGVDWGVWGAPLIVLAVGVLAGAVLALRGQARWDHDPRTEDLKQRKANLLQSLRDLEANRSRMTEAAYATERQTLLAAAAKVARELEEGPSRRPSPESAQRRTMGGLVQLVIVLSVLVVAGAVLQTALKPRAPGEGMTGNSQETEQSPVMALVSEAQATLEEDPADFDALCVTARWAIVTQDLNTAMQAVEGLRTQQPEHACSLGSLAALNLAISRVEDAQAQLANIPEPNTWSQIWVGLIARNQGDDATAQQIWTEVVRAPDDAVDAEFANFLLQDLLTPRTPPPTQASAEPKVTGTVTGELTGEGVLYIYVRPMAASSGPPFAAKRIDDWTLPLEFSLSEAERLPMWGGQPWPEEVWISAKLARSGDPKVPSPDDVETTPAGPFREGDVVTLELK